MHTIRQYEAGEYDAMGDGRGDDLEAGDGQTRAGDVRVLDIRMCSGESEPFGHLEFALTSAIPGWLS